MDKKVDKPKEDGELKSPTVKTKAHKKKFEAIKKDAKPRVETKKNQQKESGIQWCMIPIDFLKYTPIDMF